MLPQLNAAEQKWLDDYRQALDEQYPGRVLRMLRYGVEAQRYLFDDNEFNLLLVTRDDAQELKSPLAILGYSLSDPFKIWPGIMVWTQEDFNRHKKCQSTLLAMMEKHGVWLE